MAEAANGDVAEAAGGRAAEAPNGAAAGGHESRLRRAQAFRIPARQAW